VVVGVVAVKVAVAVAARAGEEGAVVGVRFVAAGGGVAAGVIAAATAVGAGE